MKRKTGRRRHPCGKIVRTPTPNDDGTPELQAIRKAILGEKANGLPLSHESPVDVLCARGYLTTTQVAAARAYQTARRAVYGASTARAATPLAAPTSGRTTGPLARLQAKRNLIAWQRLIDQRPLFCQVQFYQYVCAEVWTAALMRHAATGEPTVTYRVLAELLDDIAETPRQHVSHDEIERAEIQEMIG